MPNPRRTTVAWLKYDAMADATRDFVRLYEVVWNASPALRHEQRVELARQAVRELISDDLVEFFRIAWSAPEAVSEIDVRRARQLMEEAEVWEPPPGDQPGVSFRAKYPEVSYEGLWQAVLEVDPEAVSRSRWD
jgi:hypothetical protein